MGHGFISGSFYCCYTKRGKVPLCIYRAFVGGVFEAFDKKRLAAAGLGGGLGVILLSYSVNSLANEANFTLNDAVVGRRPPYLCAD